jgi:transposase
MKDVNDLLKQWHLDVRSVRERMYRSLTPRERERWHALWLLSRGCSAVQVGEALERDAHTIGGWLADFEQTGGSPPPSTRSSRPG